jgi:hypothetical protein
MGAPATLLENAFADLAGRRNIYDQVARDLHTRGLLTIDSLHTTMSDQECTQSEIGIVCAATTYECEAAAQVTTRGPMRGQAEQNAAARLDKKRCISSPRQLLQPNLSVAGPPRP